VKAPNHRDGIACWYWQRVHPAKMISAAHE